MKCATVFPSEEVKFQAIRAERRRASEAKMRSTSLTINEEGMILGSRKPATLKGYDARNRPRIQFQPQLHVF